MVAKKKPTPAQANLLKAITINGYFIDASTDRNGRCYRAAIRNGKDWKSHEVIRPATFRSCLKNGWIEQDKKDSWHDTFKISTLGELMLMDLSDEDFIRQGPEITTKDILAALRDKYRPPEWVFFPELRFGTGYDGMVMSRIDAWVISCWRSKHSVNYLKIAFEIKVYRSDFLKEIKDPRKRKPAFLISNQYYFAAPKGMLMVGEIPEGCGLMEIDTEGKVTTAHKAPTRKVDNPPWTFVASLGRRLQMDTEDTGREGGRE